MSDTVKKEMTLRLESSYGSFVLIALNDEANEWLDENLGGDYRCLNDGSPSSMRWTFPRHQSLERVFEAFMREGGVIG